jgi:hypothetical protein
VLSTLFDINVQGDIQDYLGIQMLSDNEKMYMPQPHLIDSILKGLGLLDANGKPNSKVATKDLPSMTTRKITADTNGTPLSFNWNYQTVVGKLNYLKKSKISHMFSIN